MDGIRSHVTDLHNSRSRSNSYETNDVQLWKTITSALEKEIDKFILSQMSSTKHKLPWIKVNSKSLYGIRDKAYSKYKAKTLSKDKIFQV